jgi:hypothetical protein
MNRRQFAVGLGVSAEASLAARGSATPGIATKPSAQHTDFADVKHIDAGLLNVGYAEAGPRRTSPAPSWRSPQTEPAGSAQEPATQAPPRYHHRYSRPRRDMWRG